MENPFSPENNYFASQAKQKITDISRNFLNLYVLCSASLDFYRAYKNNPLQFLTTGFYGPNISFPGCGMFIPKHAHIYLSPLPSRPWIAIFEPNSIPPQRLPPKQETFADFGDLLKLFPNGVQAALAKIGEEIMAPPSTISTIKIQEMKNLIFASLENLRSTISISRDNIGNQHTGSQNPGTVELQQFREFNSYCFPNLPSTPSRYQIVIVIPDWSDYFDDLLTVSFQDTAGHQMDEITLTTC